MRDICIYCKSKDIVKFGKMRTKQRNRIRRLLCKKCNKTFCKDDGFEWKHRPKEKIVETIEFYVVGGNSLRFLAENLAISKNTILR